LGHPLGWPNVRKERKEYKPWLLKAYDDYGRFIELSGVETK